MTLIGPTHPETKRCADHAERYKALGITVHLAHRDGFPQY
jgi:hypothetical protein